jgi:hypothetical protein
MWYFNDAPFTETPDKKDYYGFVYVITNLTNGRMYVGRKYFFSKKRKKLVESDWKKYYGSSEELLGDIELLGKDNFRREIISIHPTKGDVNYSETKELFSRNVLEEKNELGGRLYYNGNIMSRYFVRKETTSLETRRKLSEANKGKKMSDESKRKIFEKLSGVPKPKFSDDHILNLSASHIGKIPWNKGKKTGIGGFRGPRTQEHKDKIAATLKTKGIRPKTCTEPMSEVTRKKLSDIGKERYKLMGSESIPDNIGRTPWNKGI